MRFFNEFALSITIISIANGRGAGERTTMAICRLRALTGMQVCLTHLAVCVSLLLAWRKIELSFLQGLVSLQAPSPLSLCRSSIPIKIDPLPPQCALGSN